MTYRGDYRGDYARTGDFLGIGKKLHEAVKAFGTGFRIGTAPLRIPLIGQVARKIGGPLGFVAQTGVKLAHMGGGHTAPIGSSSAGTPHGRDPAIDTFLRGGGRFSSAGKAKLRKMHDEKALIEAGVHPAIAHHAAHSGSRRMRWSNPKALARAERRIHSAVKHMTKYIRWVHPTKQGHAAPRFGRHKGKR